MSVSIDTCVHCSLVTIQTDKKFTQDDQKYKIKLLFIYFLTLQLHNNIALLVLIEKRQMVQCLSCFAPWMKSRQKT
jgi:hypothetical protein